MRKVFQVVRVNILVLTVLLFAPASAFALYKTIKLSLQPVAVSESIDQNPVYSSAEERKIAEGLRGDSESATTYKSFVGWKREPFTGQYKNVYSDYNVRASTNHNLNDSIWFFGGSTMWGTGAQDSETIPSWVARLTSHQVSNFGETAWVSRQSVNQLMTLLSDNLYPQHVVFYDGVNDILHGCRSDHLNVPAHGRESFIQAKLSQTPIQALLADAQPFTDFLAAPYKAVAAKLGFPVSRHQSYGSMDCSSNIQKAERIAQHLVSNWFFAYKISQAYGAEFTAVLQPHAFVSQPKKDYLHSGESYLEPEYAAVYPLIESKIESFCELDAEFCKRIVNGKTWLDGSVPVYLDFCHVTGRGNELIATTLVQSFRL